MNCIPDVLGFVCFTACADTVGVCALDADVCVSKDKETGGQLGGKGSPQEREGEKEILEP